MARFGESLTLRGFVFKEAWRYRDYVIDAFNTDMPFDRFVREQIAGDLLPAADASTTAAGSSIATTFLALGNTNLEEQDKAQLRMDVVDEQLDDDRQGVPGPDGRRAPAATTTSSTRSRRADYYALAGILRNAKALEHANVSKWIEVPLPGRRRSEEAAFKKHDEAVAALAGAASRPTQGEGRRRRPAEGVLAGQGRAGHRRR